MEQHRNWPGSFRRQVEMDVHFLRSFSLSDMNDAVPVFCGYTVQRDLFAHCCLETHLGNPIRHSAENLAFVQFE
jgi:hypothetical protein